MQRMNESHNLGEVLNNIMPERAEEILQKYNKTASALATSIAEGLVDDTAQNQIDTLVDSITGLTPESSDDNRERIQIFESELDKINDSLLREQHSNIEFFRQIDENFNFGLSPKTLEAYAKAYAKIPAGRRPSLSGIERELLEFADFLPEANGYKKQKLLEALGILINGGKTEKDSDFFAENLERIGLDIVAMRTRVAELEKQILALKKLKPYKELQEYVKLNSNWFYDMTWSIDQSVHLAKLVEEKIGKNQQALAELSAQTISLKQSFYLNLHAQAKANGTPVGPLLISAFDDLGEKIPQALKAEFEGAKNRKITTPGTSEFDKLFYAKKYEESLKLLAQQNAQRDTVGEKNWAKFRADEVLSIYEDITGNPNGKNAKLSLELTDILKRRGFAGTKIANGYTCLFRFSYNSEILGDSVKDVAGYVIAKETKDGNLSVFMVNFDGQPVGERGFVSSGEAKEYAVTKEVARRSTAQGAEIETNFNRLALNMPSINKLRDASAVISEKFIPLQQLFVAAVDGKKTADFADLAKGYARELKNSPSLANLKEYAALAKHDLELLGSLPSGSNEKFEKQVMEMQQALSQVVNLVDKGTIDYFCDQILNPAFNADTWKSWVTKEGIVMASAILFAVGAIVVITATISTGGVAGLAIASAAGTLGGVVGSEIGMGISEYAGGLVYGENFTNRSLLGQYFSGDKIVDPETGELKQVNGIDLTQVYGKQVVFGFVTTFALLGLGTLAGQSLSKFAAVNSAAAGVTGFAARLLEKLPRIRPEEIDLLSKSSVRALSKRLAEEYLEELGEEGVENVAEKIGPLSGFLAQLAFCVNGGKVRYSLGKHKVAMVGVSQTGNKVTSTFKYSAAEGENVAALVKRTYEAQGFKVTIEPNGTIRAKSEITLKNGETARAVTVFEPTRENITMLENTLEAEALYGLKSVNGNEYEFSTMSPKGKIDLRAFLERRGFIVEQAQDGSLEARMGDEVIKLRKAKKGAERISSETAKPIDIAELKSIALTDPDLFETLVSQMEVINFSPQELEAILRNQQRAGITLKPELVVKILSKMPSIQEFAHLATKQNIDNLVEDLSPAEQTQVRAFLKHGDTISGLFLAMFLPGCMGPTELLDTAANIVGGAVIVGGIMYLFAPTRFILKLLWKGGVFVKGKMSGTLSGGKALNLTKLPTAANIINEIDGEAFGDLSAASRQAIENFHRTLRDQLKSFKFRSEEAGEKFFKDALIYKYITLRIEEIGRALTAPRLGVGRRRTLNEELTNLNRRQNEMKERFLKDSLEITSRLWFNFKGKTSGFVGELDTQLNLMGVDPAERAELVKAAKELLATVGSFKTPADMLTGTGWLFGRHAAEVEQLRGRLKFIEPEYRRARAVIDSKTLPADVKAFIEAEKFVAKIQRMQAGRIRLPQRLRDRYLASRHGQRMMQRFLDANTIVIGPQSPELQNFLAARDTVNRYEADNNIANVLSKLDKLYKGIDDKFKDKDPAIRRVLKEFLKVILVILLYHGAKVLFSGLDLISDLFDGGDDDDEPTPIGGTEGGGGEGSGSSTGDNLKDPWSNQPSKPSGQPSPEPPKPSEPPTPQAPSGDLYDTLK